MKDSLQKMPRRKKRKRVTRERRKVSPKSSNFYWKYLYPFIKAWKETNIFFAMFGFCFWVFFYLYPQNIILWVLLTLLILLYVWIVISTFREEKKLKVNPLYKYFKAQEGGDTYLYYLKIFNNNKEDRYKVGITINNVRKRYCGHNGCYIVLYERKLTNAISIEYEIKKRFNHLITYEELLGTKGTEIFSEDVLKLDNRATL